MATTPAFLALIIGGSSGMGKQTAKRLDGARRGIPGGPVADDQIRSHAILPLNLRDLQ
jgi:NAD(P)-dependent dehydrogenase (short-subunit alcohol dehydrogenase family)